MGGVTGGARHAIHVNKGLVAEVLLQPLFLLVCGHVIDLGLRARRQESRAGIGGFQYLVQARDKIIRRLAESGRGRGLPPGLERPVEVVADEDGARIRGLAVGLPLVIALLTWKVCRDLSAGDRTSA